VMRKHVLVLGVLVASLLALTSAVRGDVGIATKPHRRLNPDSLDRIHPGMTRADVEAIFRGAPGDYSFGVGDLVGSRSATLRQASEGRLTTYPPYADGLSRDAADEVSEPVVPAVEERWTAGKWTITVYFSLDGLVLGTQLLEEC